VLNNDIVGGNRTPGDTKQDPNWVRVFSEGLPAAATEAELKGIRAIGGENDSPSRELARYVREVGDTFRFGQFTPKLIFAPRSLPAGRRPQRFHEQGFAAVRFTEYREDFNHQHQTPRTEKASSMGTGLSTLTSTTSATSPA